MAVRLDLGYRATFILDDVADAAAIMKLLGKAHHVKEATDRWLDAEYEEHYDRVYTRCDNEVRYQQLVHAPVVLTEAEYTALLARRAQERAQLEALKEDRGIEGAL